MQALILVIISNHLQRVIHQMLKGRNSRGVLVVNLLLSRVSYYLNLPLTCILFSKSIFLISYNHCACLSTWYDYLLFPCWVFLCSNSAELHLPLKSSGRLALRPRCSWCLVVAFSLDGSKCSCQSHCARELGPGGFCLVCHSALEKKCYVDTEGVTCVCA